MKSQEQSRWAEEGTRHIENREHERRYEQSIAQPSEVNKASATEELEALVRHGRARFAWTKRDPVNGGK